MAMRESRRLNNCARALSDFIGLGFCPAGMRCSDARHISTTTNRFYNSAVKIDTQIQIGDTRLIWMEYGTFRLMVTDAASVDSKELRL